MRRPQLQCAPSETSPSLASRQQHGSTRLPHTFVHCINGIHVSRLPALWGIQIIVSRGMPCVAVGGRHDLLAKRAGQHLPQLQH